MADPKAAAKAMAKYTLPGLPRELAKRFWTTADLARVSGLTWATVYKAEQGETISIPDAGDFEGDQGFSVTAWVKLPTANAPGSIVARMDFWTRTGRRN